MSYRKLRPGDPAYDTMRMLRENGHQVCDAVTHNSNRGCKNPTCWKYEPDPKTAPRTLAKRGTRR